ncbi:TPA: hypothetical protein JQH91_004703, partial [Shigella sonnei]|nr:hypothetical protein [Shigella sonnei]
PLFRWPNSVCHFKPSDWDSLPDTDLRYIYSQRQPEKTMHERLKGKGVIVDMASLFKQAG